jgi:hypothetical protein
MDRALKRLRPFIRRENRHYIHELPPACRLP